MPCFRCSSCGCVENTALSNYWADVLIRKVQPQCTECKTGVWHGLFDKMPAAGWYVDQEGFLWKSPSQLPNHYRVVGKMLESGQVDATKPESDTEA